MFSTPKPRQFTYRPRFYDPEKEEWERIKRKYASESESSATATDDTSDPSTTDNEVAYFERRLREMEREERAQASKFGWRDLFRKREMPSFHYTPRFSTADSEAATEPVRQNKTKRKITRRFDMESVEYFKPVPAGKIMLYTLAALLLLAWILL